MTISTGFKVFAIASILAFALPAIAQTPAHTKSETGLTAKYKAQLEAAAAAAKAVPIQQETTTIPASSVPSEKIGPIDESELQDLEPLPVVAEDAQESEPLRVSLDKPEIVHLERDAVNVIVGSNENLRVVPDTNKTLVLIAKKPGSTYFRALDADGKVIMQRHVIIGSPTKNYIRIRRACANGAQGCKQYSVYYCPDMCHEVDVVQDASGPSAAIPEETPAGANSGNGGKAELNQDLTETPKTEEPPPGE